MIEEVDFWIMLPSHNHQLLRDGEDFRNVFHKYACFLLSTKFIISNFLLSDGS